MAIRIQRGRGTTARQVTGRTRSLGVPGNGGVIRNAPTRPLKDADTRRIPSS